MVREKIQRKKIERDGSKEGWLGEQRENWRWEKRVRQLDIVGRRLKKGHWGKAIGMRRIKKRFLQKKGANRRREKKEREDLGVTRVGYERKRSTKGREIGKIKKSRYNVQYKGERVSQYLKKRWQKIARFRLENEMREGRYYIY